MIDMTQEELKKFQANWIHEAELELSSMIDRECRLGYQWDEEIYDQYSDILKEMLSTGDITFTDFKTLEAMMIVRKRPDDDNGEDQEREKS